MIEKGLVTNARRSTPSPRSSPSLPARGAPTTSCMTTPAPSPTRSIPRRLGPGGVPHVLSEVGPAFRSSLHQRLVERRCQRRAIKEFACRGCRRAPLPTSPRPGRHPIPGAGARENSIQSQPRIPMAHVHDALRRKTAEISRIRCVLGRSWVVLEGQRRGSPWRRSHQGSSLACQPHSWSLEESQAELPRPVSDTPGFAGTRYQADSPVSGISAAVTNASSESRTASSSSFS